jgi:hypothetical protein
MQLAAHPGTPLGGEHAMKSPAVLIGVVLIVIGVIALAYQGITYTTQEKILDLGPLKATAEKKTK